MLISRKEVASSFSSGELYVFLEWNVNQLALCQIINSVVLKYVFTTNLTDSKRSEVSYFKCQISEIRRDYDNINIVCRTIANVHIVCQIIN